MRKKNYKGRCEKQSLDKFTTICKTYDPIQSAYANILVKNKDVAEVRCNVPLDGDECGECLTCILVCPYGAMSQDANGAVQKCELCMGNTCGEPACVKGCPNKAIVYEER